MKLMLRMLPLSTMVLFAPLAFSQEQAPAKEQAAPATVPAHDAPAAEARRQGRVAMKPNADSPTQSMSQAIAFEKYKEMAAKREARKSGEATSADRNEESKPAKVKR